MLTFALSRDGDHDSILYAGISCSLTLLIFFFFGIICLRLTFPTWILILLSLLTDLSSMAVALDKVSQISHSESRSFIYCPLQVLAGISLPYLPVQTFAHPCSLLYFIQHVYSLKASKLLYQLKRRQISTWYLNIGQSLVWHTGTHVRLATAFQHDQVFDNCFGNVYYWGSRRSLTFGKFSPLL